MSTVSSSLRKYPKALFVLLIVGFLVRLLFIAAHQRPLYSDEKEYNQLAQNLATKATYSYDSMPTAYRPVGYPAVVSGVYFIFGHSLAPVKLLQALSDIGISFLIYLLLAEQSERTRIVGAGLWIVFAPAIFYSSLLLSETFFTFLLVFAVWSLVRKHESDFWNNTMLGATLGFLILIKPTAVALVLVLPFLLPNLRTSFRRVYPVLLAILLVLIPWLTRNYLVFGELALSSNGGINLLIGNNPASTGAYKIAFEPSIFQDVTGEFEVDHKAFRIATDFVASNPMTSVANAVRKTGRLLESEGALLILTFHDNPEDASTSYAAKYASLPLIWILVGNFSYFLIVLASIFGFLSAERDWLWRVVLAAFACWIIIHAIFFGGGRFHFPLMPFFAVYAAQFLIEPRRCYSSLSGFQKILGYGTIAAFCVLWTFEAYLVFHG